MATPQTIRSGLSAALVHWDGKTKPRIYTCYQIGLSSAVGDRDLEGRIPRPAVERKCEGGESSVVDV